MRILHYTWADPQDPAGRGGGVTVYLQALVAAQKAVAGAEVRTLSSGLSYDLRNHPPRWRETRAGHYEIVNSATLAPSHADFATTAQLDNGPTVAAFLDFLTTTGPYDVLHLHGLEGVPAQVLTLKQRFPDMRLVLSLHNYHAFCPQVNLWWQEQAHCADFDAGARCDACLPTRPNPRAVRAAYRVETALARVGMGPGTLAYDGLWRRVMRQGWRAIKAIARLGKTQAQLPPDIAQPHMAARFRARRAGMVDLINSHCDIVLAVSDRTRQIAEGFGLKGVRTSYIGTAHARCWSKTFPRSLPQSFTTTRPLRLTYLGYMRRDKGFEFLLDALAALPPKHASRVHLRVAARRGGRETMAAMAQLAPVLAGLDWDDGYDHAGLDALLADTDFGVVPPLWEDNLPQTALEMHCRHIPLITSDRGGVQELGNCALLTFPAGDKAAFCALIARVLGGQLSMADYWANARAPISMPDHVKDMLRLYTGPS